MKREYKVGDTIYLKGTVRSVDDTALPYCVYFRNYNTVWVTSDSIIDELPTAEPVKPVLPKAVADEMSYVKSFDGITFDGYIVQIINGNSTYKNSRAFWINSSDGIIKTLMDAWNNGYTVEEKKYNLILGTGTDGDTNALFKSNPCTDASLCIDADTYADDLKRDKFYQFTQSEIDKYNKDFWIKGIDLNDYKVEVDEQ